MASLTVLERARLLVEPAMAAAVDRLCGELRLPLRYHLGWTGPDGSPSDAGSGKGLRPARAALPAERPLYTSDAADDETGEDTGGAW